MWIEILKLGGAPRHHIKSQPARAVWIEIFPPSPSENVNNGHSLRGLCGLKYVDVSMYIPGH